MVYKEMSLRPCILDGFNGKKRGSPPGGRYASKDDVLFLEDDSGRLNLWGNIDAGKVFTGMPIGCIGYLSNGRFKVQTVIYPNPPLQTPWKPQRTDTRKRYLCLMSG